jgi:hypothetical protein
MAEDSREAEADRSHENSPALSVGFDNYRSLDYSQLIIFVAKDVVPPFRPPSGGLIVCVATDLRCAAHDQTTVESENRRAASRI